MLHCHTRLPSAAQIGHSKRPLPSAVYYFVHGTRYRITQSLTRHQWRRLRSNCDDAYMLKLGDDRRLCTPNDPRPLSISKNYIKGYLDDVLVVVKPNKKALLFLDALPGVILNYVEFARDQIVTDAELVHDRFVEHFVHRWHGKHETLFRIKEGEPQDDDDDADYDEPPDRPIKWPLPRPPKICLDDVSTGTSYTGQRRRGHLFACYSDLHSRETGELSCFHLEGRYQGTAALRPLVAFILKHATKKDAKEHATNARRLRPSDLIDFPHEVYWQQVLQHLYTIDFERLGRHDANRRRRERRRSPIITCSGRYNQDAATGGGLYHVLGRHPKQSYRSVQRFLDVYKPRARPFLTRIRWSDLIDPAFPLFCQTRPWETHHR